MLIPAAALLLSAAHPAAPAGVPWRAGVPLTRDGARLMYDGLPFAAVGVNKHELIEQYLAAELGRSPEEAAQSRAAAKLSLQRLAAAGIRVVRMRACPFWPAWATRTLLSDDPAVRTASWAAFDELLDDCDRNGIRVIPSLSWNLGVFPDLGHESLSDFVTMPDSPGRILLRQWIEALVGRYAGRDTILFWELGNEWNLMADLRPMFAEKGVFEGIDPPGAQELLGGPVVRDGTNNLSSDELAAFTRDLCRLIKSVDGNHLVGTGCSAPRSSAWHLWLGSIRRATEMDWTLDTPEQQSDYLRLITPPEVDVISLHWYGDGASAPAFAGLLDLRLAADSIATPVYVGEVGVSADTFKGPVYDDPAAVDALRLLLDGLREAGIPLALAWTWDEWGEPIHEPVLRPETQPAVVTVLREADEAAAEAAQGLPPEPDEARARLDEIAAQLRALRP